MLIPGFYTIEEFEVSENQVHAQIRLNPNHDVYKGHFPNQPVVPGVIQLQMIKELMEKALQEKLLLKQMIFAKYLNVMLPGNNSDICVSIDFKVHENQWKFSALIKDNTFVFTKVKGTLSVEIDKPAL